MSITYLKMANGEDLVVDLVSEHPNNITVTNPLILKTYPIDGGSGVMSGFFPWVPIYQLMGSEYDINKINIMAMATVPELIQLQYTRVLGAIIVAMDTPIDCSDNSQLNIETDDSEYNDTSEYTIH